MAKKVFVLSNKASLMEDLLAGASIFGETAAVVVGNDAEVLEKAAVAETVYQISLPEGYIAEDAVDSLEKLVKEEAPDVLLVGATLTGRAIVGRLAARLNTAVFADAKGLSVSDDGVEAVNMVYGGGANLTQKAKGSLTIALLGFGTLEKTDASPGAGTVKEVAFVEPAWRIEVKETRKREASSVNLPAAKKIVSFGLGVSDQKDISLIQELAKVFEAEVGCSRPIAEGLNWMPKECYVGISGVFSKADCYVAVGISGQVQHMVGVKDVKTIVAINKDANAPIMKQCDYGLAGDLYEVIPALVKKLS